LQCKQITEPVSRGTNSCFGRVAGVVRSFGEANATTRYFTAIAGSRYATIEMYHYRLRGSLPIPHLEDMTMSTPHLSAKGNIAVSFLASAIFVLLIPEIGHAASPLTLAQANTCAGCKLEAFRDCCGDTNGCVDASVETMCNTEAFIACQDVCSQEENPKLTRRVSPHIHTQVLARRPVSLLGCSRQASVCVKTYDNVRQ